MKITTVIMGIFFYPLIMVVIPIACVLINDYLSLPVFSNFFMQSIGTILSLLGILLLSYCVYLFFKDGKGTPAPIDPPKKLVVKGIYKYSRNPMYLGYLTVILGEALIFDRLLSFIYWLFVFFVLRIFIVFYEEPGLKKRFGKSYTGYYKKTPRWF